MADWRPQPKIAAAAAAALAVWGLSLAGIDVPIGVEGAIVTLVGYLMPNRPGWTGPLTADE